MDFLLSKITARMASAFEACGYAPEYARVTLSNRPDLCEYQCNGALSAAKAYHTAPLQIAQTVAQTLSDCPLFSEVSAVKPGFINLRISAEALSEFLNEMAQSERLGCPAPGAGKTVIIDYGGANVAKPLHVGHLRSAIIGESMKRVYRFLGYTAIGDVHLGDWGLQMGLIIEETHRRFPNLPYFDKGFSGEYPQTAPFTISDLEEIYPMASARSKTDEVFAAAAHEATARLQQGDRGYEALFKHILAVSIADLKKNYGNLGVTFDLWKGESDAQPYIEAMLADFKAKELLVESRGALVIDVSEPEDTKEIPPCIIQKSDGAYLYATTDLATLIEREQLYHPDEVFYITDKRQAMHFTQVFRAARKAGIVREETVLSHLPFGTMNGKDGKPFKTRDGGVMRLEHLIADISRAVYERMLESDKAGSPQEARQTAAVIGLAALKYGDLSNQASKDYVFDIERFSSFEGNTGPYILYTIVRIKSILAKYAQAGGNAADAVIRPCLSEAEKELQLLIARAADTIIDACREKAPHKLCLYIYELSNAFNRFYHETKILGETDAQKQSGWIALLALTEKVLATIIDLLGFEAPDKM